MPIVQKFNGKQAFVCFATRKPHLVTAVEPSGSSFKRPSYVSYIVMFTHLIREFFKTDKKDSEKSKKEFKARINRIIKFASPDLRLTYDIVMMAVNNMQGKIPDVLTERSPSSLNQWMDDVVFPGIRLRYHTINDEIANRREARLRRKEKAKWNKLETRVTFAGTNASEVVTPPRGDILNSVVAVAEHLDTDKMTVSVISKNQVILDGGERAFIACRPGLISTSCTQP